MGLSLIGSSMVSTRTTAAALSRDQEEHLERKRESDPSAPPSPASKKPEANVARNKAIDNSEKVAAQNKRREAEVYHPEWMDHAEIPPKPGISMHPSGTFSATAKNPDRESQMNSSRQVGAIEDLRRGRGAT